MLLELLPLMPVMYIQAKQLLMPIKQLMNKDYNNVIVISPSHREYFRGVSIYPGDAYKTPLGEIPINTKLREKLISRK